MRARHGGVLLAPALLTLVIMGCGGSSSRPSATTGRGGATMTVQWPTATSRFIPVAANSIVVSFLQGSTVVASTNPPIVRPTTTCTLNNIPVGTYTVQAAAYASTTGTGTVLASVSVTGVVITLNQITPVQGMAMGTTITTVTVTPSPATVAAGKTATLTASATDGSLNAVLVAPSVWQWSSSNKAAATVAGSGTDNTATVTGVAAGSATITATDSEDPDKTVLGTASVSVPGSGKADWTVMIYLDASNDLDPYGVINVEQLEQLPANANVNFVVLMKRQWNGNTPMNDPATGVWSDARYFKIGYYPNEINSTNGAMTSSLLPAKGGTAVDAGNVDMGIPATVRNFITYCTTNYPAQHYALDFWDHGSGVVQGYSPDRAKRLAKPRDVCFDDQTGNDLSTAQMSQAVGTSPVLDIVMCDACNLAMPEVAYQMKNGCNYFVGSEDATPGYGYPYNTIFANLVTTPTESAASLCSDIVTNMVAFYQASGANQTAATQCALNESGMSTLCSAIGAYGAALSSKDSVDHAKIQAAITASTTFNDGDPTTSYEDYHDLVDLINKVNTQTSDSSLATAGATVVSALNACIVKQAETTLETSPCYGVAIYTSSTTWWPYERAEYEACQFSIDNPNWPAWIDTFTGVR